MEQAKKKKLNMLFNILFIIANIGLVAMYAWMQKDLPYLYDTSFLHKYIYILAIISCAVIVVIALMSKQILLKGPLWAVEATIFLAIIIVFGLLSYVPIIPSKSATTDINNYKKFDSLVRNEAYNFFPDDIGDYEVIRYDYYYEYRWNHVYSIYLEIRVDDIETFLEPYFEKGFQESEYLYDNKFKKLSLNEDDETEPYTRIKNNEELGRGEIKIILYSEIEHIIILQHYESWDSCTKNNIYYFKRFSIGPAE